MLPVRVEVLPVLLRPDDLHERTAVVFDVLRATTTIATALHAGATAVRVFDTINDARRAAEAFDGPKCLVGEQNAVRPDGFDAGNSPRTFTPDFCRGRTLLMATTNGTRTLSACRTAAVLMTGAIVNAKATARAALRAGRPVTMVCSGTDGFVSGEDLAGCGAVIDAVRGLKPENDAAVVARTVWRAHRGRLGGFCRSLRSGHNLVRAGLIADVPGAMRLDAIDLACHVETGHLELVVRPWAD